MSVDELVNKDKFKEFEKINKKVVQNFISSRGHTNKVGKQEILHYNKKAVGRVYHLEPSGYVVATLNKNEVPIKAYSFSGNFDDLPEGYKEVIVSRLYDYSVLMDKVEKEKITIETDNNKIWSYLESYTKTSPKPIIESNVINTSSGELPPEMPKDKRAFAPNQDNNILLDTRWGQFEPFNDLNIVLFNPDENEWLPTPTGCTMTAWAQIMKFHEWPEDSVGTTESYLWRTEYLSRNLDNTAPYDWENMSNLGSSEVAPLMTDIGYALKANWKYSGAEAYGENDFARGAIAKHFGYSTNMTLLVYDNFKSSTQYYTYKNRVVNDINNLRPLFTTYVNWSTNISHSVVADGYRNVDVGGNSFEIHYNTGWGHEINATKDWFVITLSPLGFFDQDFVGVGTISSIYTVSGIKPCDGSDCDATFSYLSSIGGVNNGGHKDGITLVNGWNLVALMSSGTKVNYTNFTNANSVWTNDYTTTPNTWQENEDSVILHRRGMWINHSGTTEYIFPGSQTEAVELTPSYLNSLPSGKYILVGTGKDITDNRLSGLSYCRTYNASANPPTWENCSTPIPAGTGIWIKK